MPKSAQAFRTIREVADWLDVAAHVLRFWESKFNQIKPVKRAGGRRYYRPADMELVGGIKVLLHDRGMTIRGVQKLIADEGLEAVTSLSPPIDELVEGAEVVELDASDVWDEDAAAESEEAQEADAIDEADEAGEAVSIDAPEPQQSAPLAPEPGDPIPDHPISSEPEITAPEAPEAAPIPEEAPLLDAAPAPEEAPALEDAAEVTEAAPTSEEDTEAPPAEPEAAPVEAPPPTIAPSPEPTAPAIASAAAAVQIPPADPAEGALGALAALSQLPGPQRAVLRPQIMALAKLRDRMSSGATIG